MPYCLISKVRNVGRRSSCRGFQAVFMCTCILVQSVLVKPSVSWLEDEGGPLPESPVWVKCSKHCSLLEYLKFIYLFKRHTHSEIEWESEQEGGEWRERQGRQGNILYSLVHPRMPGAWSLGQSPTCGQGPRYLTCHLLPPRVYINKEMDGKQTWSSSSGTLKWVVSVWGMSLLWRQLALYLVWDR